MRSEMPLFWLRAVVSACVFSGAMTFVATGADVRVEVMRLDGLVPDLPIKLRESWNSIGIDSRDNVYTVFSSRTATASDCALFQYNARIGKRRMLGSAQTMSGSSLSKERWNSNVVSPSV